MQFVYSLTVTVCPYSEYNTGTNYNFMCSQQQNRQSIWQFVSWIFEKCTLNSIRNNKENDYGHSTNDLLILLTLSHTHTLKTIKKFRNISTTWQKQSRSNWTCTGNHAEHVHCTNIRKFRGDRWTRRDARVLPFLKIIYFCPLQRADKKEILCVFRVSVRMSNDCLLSLLFDCIFPFGYHVSVQFGTIKNKINGPVFLFAAISHSERRLKYTLAAIYNVASNK